MHLKGHISDCIQLHTTMVLPSMTRFVTGLEGTKRTVDVTVLRDSSGTGPRDMRNLATPLAMHYSDTVQGALGPMGRALIPLPMTSI